MKVIVVNRENFHNNPQTARIRIKDILDVDIEAPVYLGDSLNLPIGDNPAESELPIISPLRLVDYLTENLILTTSRCHDILAENKENILSLDLTGININSIIPIANIFSRTAFALNNKPAIYILLVNELFGADIAEHWYRAFYIEPYPAHLLPVYLSRNLFKMRARAFILRYFGASAEKIARRIWLLSMKIRRR